MRRRTACTLALLAALALPAAASASGGRYAVDGGTQAERDQVRAALQASSFPWGIVPATIAIHVRRGVVSQATPGEIWLDASLLDAGSFSWAVVQHEYAHQVDWYVLDDADRTVLQQLLGGSAWCAGGEALAHDENACERFATGVAWAYWPSSLNAFGPEPWLQPARFRLLLSTLLGVADPYGDRLTLFGGPQPQ